MIRSARKRQPAADSGRPAIEENTLGVIVGREGKQRTPKASFRRSERTVSTTRANQRGLGGLDLAGGMVTGSALMMLFLVWNTVEQWPVYTSPALALAGWIVLAATAAGAFLGVKLNGDTMPVWLFVLSLCGLYSAVLLDLIAVWNVAGPEVYPTVAIAAGVAMTPLVCVRETREVIAAALALGAVLLAAVVIEGADDVLSLAPEFVSVALALWLPLMAVAVVRAFRRMVQLELDLVLVQSAVDAPPLTVGMLASEELVRLDSDAERLLDDVAEGRTPLPLHPDAASAASKLATQLRLHLIADHKKTWLYNAVTESEFLAPAVTIDDPASLAGLLSPAQRDAMLIAVWLLVSDAESRDAAVSVEIGPRAPLSAAAPGKIQFPVFLHVTGVPRRRVDPATWEAISNIGPHFEYSRAGELHVEIECTVDNPVDA